MVSSHLQDPLLFPTGHISSPPSSMDSDISASFNETIPKKRRRGRPSKKELLRQQQQRQQQQEADRQHQIKHSPMSANHSPGHSIKRRKTLRGIRSPAPQRIGDQVEAIKWSADTKKEEWYCARVIQVDEDGRVLVHYEGWPPEDADWLAPSQLRLPERSRSALRYGPKGRESEASWRDFEDFYYSMDGERARQHTGLVQDRRMSLHACPCHSREIIHPERPDRITAILQSLHSQRLLRLFYRVRAREATTDELLHVHTFAHVRNYYPINNAPSQPMKITSIAALLNDPDPLPSPRSSPHGSSLGPLCAAGGDTATRADEEQIQRQHRRFSTCQDSPVSPPALLYMMRCGELGIAADTTFHPHYTSVSARVAAGALINLSEKIIQGQIRNGFALIRPPGHHAENDCAMGFCFFNNVAVAAAAALEKHLTKIKRVLIIDWDIHHGNGTQKVFYDNPNVLYISLHRWDQGKFYPFSGAPDECGEDAGLGRNVNIAFSASEGKTKPMGDTEFIAAFYHLLIPIARQFGPDLIYVSAGFDAAEGHPENLGGYRVTPRGFAIMTKMVMDLADETCDGRVLLCLEGGYELRSLADSASACITQLLPPDLVQDPVVDYLHSLNAIKPNEGAVQSLRTVAAIQKKYWKLPDQLATPNFRFLLPSEWRATHNFSTRAKREKRSMTTSAVEGY